MLSLQICILHKFIANTFIFLPTFSPLSLSHLYISSLIVDAYLGEGLAELISVLLLVLRAVESASVTTALFWFLVLQSTCTMLKCSFKGVDQSSLSRVDFIFQIYSSVYRYMVSLAYNYPQLIAIYFNAAVIKLINFYFISVSCKT